MRTTTYIDPLVLAALKDRQKQEGKTLGELVSELLAGALAVASAGASPSTVHWPSARMGALIDLDDEDAVWSILDGRWCRRPSM